MVTGRVVMEEVKNDQTNDIRADRWIRDVFVRYESDG